MQKAVPSVWMVTSEVNNRPPFVRTKIPGGPEVLLGPFLYSKKEDAEVAMRDPNFYVSQSQEEIPLSVLKVSGEGLIQGVLTGFDPVLPDVFMINEEMLPLSAEGATFVEHSTGLDFWSPLFAEEENLRTFPPNWVLKVFEALSEHLGVESIQMDLDPDEAEKIQNILATTQVSEHVTFQVVPEEGFRFGDLPLSTTFRVTTQGMDKFSRPDLEILKVPALFVEGAQDLLLAWAARSLREPFDVENGSLFGETTPITTILRFQESERKGVLQIFPLQIIYTNPEKSQLVH